MNGGNENKELLNNNVENNSNGEEVELLTDLPLNNINNETPNQFENNGGLVVENCFSNINNNNNSNNMQNTEIKEEIKENKIPNNIDNKPNKDEEEIVKRIVGEEHYNKYTTKLFNFIVLFFPSLYMNYTGMFFWGVIYTILSFFLNSAVLIGVCILLGFTYNKLYVSRIRKKVHNSVSQGTGVDVTCSFSWGNVFIGLVIDTIATFILVVLCTYVISLPTDSDNILSKIFNSVSENTQEEFDIYDTVDVDTSVNLANLVNINIPNVFIQENSYSYIYNYSYRLSDSESSACKFSLFVVSNYSDGDVLLEALMTDYKNKNKNMGYIASKSYSGKADDWEELYFSLDGKTEYYYTISYNNKLYLFTYVIEANASSSCTKYGEYVFKSLSFK